MLSDTLRTVVQGNQASCPGQQGHQKDWPGGYPKNPPGG
jgi:hypothetical protein